MSQYYLYNGKFNNIGLLYDNLCAVPRPVPGPLKAVMKCMCSLWENQQIQLRKKEKEEIISNAATQPKTSK